MTFHLILLVTISLFLAACGSSRTEESADALGNARISNIINGGAVTGPIANASVKIYAFDPSNTNFQSQKPVASTETAPSSGFSDLNISTNNEPPYIMVMTTVEETIDLNTNMPPVVRTMKTIVTQDMIDSGEGIYATPHTTIVLDIAIANTLSNRSPYTGEKFDDATRTVERFIAALPIAAQQVAGTLGFGLVDNIDIFTTSPQIDSNTNSTEKLSDVTSYRAAIAALTALIQEIYIKNGNLTSEQAIAAISFDLGDGTIDGRLYEQAIPNISENMISMYSQNPENLTIPNTNILVSDIEKLLKDEMTNTGAEITSNVEFTEVKTLPPELNSDTDNDGVYNSNDAFPTNPAADTDTDQDGLPDVVYVLNSNNTRTTSVDALLSDPDDDNDGVSDIEDQFPLLASEWVDTDGDGIGNNTDTDDDGDGVNDQEDSQPLDELVSNSSDEDNDGWPKGQDTDDNNPASPTIAFVDTDLDGLADNGGIFPDLDDDNDGVSDDTDAFPLNTLEQSDFDLDGIGDNSDTDIDGDGVENDIDILPRNPEEAIDTDNDGIGNNADTDDDNDKMPDVEELALGTDPLKPDTDDDGIFDNADQFPLDPLEQFDNDLDGLGNNIDDDDDNDGVLDVDDAFPFDSTESLDTDSDGIGNNVDDDDDNDGISDDKDVFPLDGTESTDFDNDGIGDNADTDDDNDKVLDVDDAFPYNYKESVDTDGDGTGNNSDRDDDNDGVSDWYDAFPLDPTEWADYDKDGIGDNADTDRRDVSVEEHLDNMRDD